MATFNLKRRDTRPILRVQLLNPSGSVYDLTGSTSWKLQIRLADAALMSRDMVVFGDATDGTLQYEWQASDWDAIPQRTALHRMEYEVVGPGSLRLTFPNDGYDTLWVTEDFGQDAQSVAVPTISAAAAAYAPAVS